MKEKILITGALGYVGGRLCEYLSGTGEYQLILTSRREHFGGRLPFRDYRLVKMDILSDEDLENVCDQVDAVIHLVATNGVDSARAPQKAQEVNAVGTARLIEHLKESKIKKFVYFSTAHVYGSPLQGHITEKTLPRPVHPYAASHKVAEDSVLEAHRSGKFCGVVFRLSNGFGAPLWPEVNCWTLLVNDLCRQAVTSREIRLRSSGSQKRDFICLSDVCRAVSHALKLPAQSLGDGLFNLGGDNTMSIMEMTEKVAERCAQVLRFSPGIHREGSGPSEESPSLVYDSSKYQSTGYQLLNPIHQEIDATLQLCQGAYPTGP